MTRAVHWLRRWGVSFASLGGGILTLFVFRRGLPNVAWIIGYLLVLWLLFALLTQLREALLTSPRAAHRLVATAGEYTIQSLYHGLLLFVLPAYYAAATPTSVNMTFVALLAGLVILATFDPWYQALVHPRPWLGSVFFLVSIFASLNVALPLLGVRPYIGLLLSAWAAVVAMTPAVRRALDWPWGSALVGTATLGIGAAAIVGVACIAVPPAPLFLARASLGWNVGGAESLAPVGTALPFAELKRRGLVAYTDVYAPAGLRQPVAHVWRHEGQVVNVVRLDAAGGRRQGYRTWSRKTTFPPDSAGRWTVDVMTTSGQLLGRLSFRVIA